MSTSSNRKRKFWRLECRRALAGEISESTVTFGLSFANPCSGSRLGLEIEPSLVRLKPAREDPYRWVVADSIRKIFKSNLSTVSVTDCQKICEALKSDRSSEMIKAVSPHTVQDEDELFEDPHRAMSPDHSLTIQILEFEKQELILENQKLREKEQGLLNAHQEWEAERQCLQQAMSQWKQVAEARQARLDAASQNVVPAMEKLRLCLSEFFETTVSGQC
ncbi:hypothetical protein CBS63078_8316 [Aspergillus niger]|nr:hypothetical protein CBS11350_7455 [Aspergillus niger]KAI2895977.1 hypothetical protein CBS63078_8316 [Aspergillus niger]GKZ63043.1 hypothetical protein AnigIFM49718_010774 [Aspergillus niger]